jgi:hypothetical protein
MNSTIQKVVRFPRSADDWRRDQPPLGGSTGQFRAERLVDQLHGAITGRECQPSSPG